MVTFMLSAYVCLFIMLILFIYNTLNSLQGFTQEQLVTRKTRSR